MPGTMRVVGGSARGVPLRAPPGGATRPTTGRLRESLFSMLEAANTDLSCVADLYAGSGALGIEALSRGAERCTFVEADRRACEVLRDNLRRTRLEACADVVAARVGRWQPEAGTAYTLVVADPPYDDASAGEAIERSLEGALAPHAVVVLEHAARGTPPPELSGRVLWRDRRQGDGAVAVYRRAEDAGEERA